MPKQLLLRIRDRISQHTAQFIRRVEKHLDVAVRLVDMNDLISRSAQS